MADLIIKPNSATGDKLILQDRAGGAVLTTADSGATIASGVVSGMTGIPAAGVTGVLPVGVTGGSGLTALGTVASGNLSNTAIVYPTGHVVQTKHGNYQAPVVYSSGTHKIMEIFMTPRQTNSKFLIDIRLMHGMPTASNMDSHNFGLQLGYKNTPASSTVGDYASVGGRSDTYEHMSMATGDGRYTLFSSDVVMGTDYGNYGSRYWMNQKAFLVEASPTIPSPPVAIYFSLWVSNDTSWVFSNSQYMETSGGNDYSGAVSSIQLSEIAG